MNLHGYCDSNIACDKDIGKSTNGYIYIHADRVISDVQGYNRLSHCLLQKLLYVSCRDFLGTHLDSLIV